MVDLVVTAASVAASAAAVKGKGTAGATILAGHTLYKDTADLDGNGVAKLKLGDSDGSALLRVCAGIALHAASSGQPIQYVIEDPAFTPGATMTVGVIYALSDTPGGLMPVADLEAGDYPSVILIATSTTVGVMKIVTGTTAI